MGYLKQNVRRGPARREKLALLSRPLPPSVLRWLDAPDMPPVPEQVAYVRLTTDTIDASSGQFLGVFGAAYQLRRSGRASPDDARRLGRSLRWFGHNLHAPKQVAPLAIFWFRTDARLFIQKLWTLVRVLRRYGVRVTSLTTERPGRIAYRDRFQVAAIPDEFLAVDVWAGGSGL